MRLVAYIVSVTIYLAAVLYLLLRALGFGFGIRIGGNLFAEVGFGFQRSTYLALLLLLLFGGIYAIWRINRRLV